MGKFNFRLQKLLDLRLGIEEESKKNFNKAQEDKLVTEGKLEKLRNNYLKYSEVRKNSSIVEQKIAQAYLNSLTLCIQETSIELEDKLKILEERRSDLKQKQIERKTVEILKDKQKAIFVKEQNLLEQKANDEFALYGFIRNIERR